MVLYEVNILDLIGQLNDLLDRYKELISLQDKVKFIATKPNNNLNGIILELEKTIISICDKIQNAK